MNVPEIQVLLADDDSDDRILFKKALEELPLKTNLIAVNGGEELMELLENKTIWNPTLLFLDINMPRKNGFECLAKINQDKKQYNLSVVILSASVDQNMLTLLHCNGADRYIRKPIEFGKLKQVIYNAINELIFSATDKDKFLFQF